MYSLQKKLLLYIVIIGVIPTLLFAFFYYNIASDRVTDKLYNESYSVLKKLDNKLTVKINRLQNTLDIILDDADFFAQLRDEKLPQDIKYDNVQKGLDEIYSKFVRSERSLKTIILFTVDGEIYTCGEPLSESDPVRQLMAYDYVGEEAGIISWLGIKDNYDNEQSNVIGAATMLRDGSYMKDNVYVGSIYMFFDNNLFIGEYESYPEMNSRNENNRSDSAISVYDSNIKLIYTKGNEQLKNVFAQRPIPDILDVNSTETGSYKVTINETDFISIYYTSPITSWKFVQTMACDKYYGALMYVKYMVLICFILIFAIWYICNYFIVNKIMAPIRELTGAMQSIEENNFEVQLDIHSKDFKIIIEGFNGMLAHIKNLLARIRFEEEKRRQNDILMLRYQMNPHFLYNTLSAIRLTAIMNKQSKIADMLLILGRFLRNAILTVNSTLDVKSEIDNIKDYISLYQIRYNDKLQVEINADEKCYNYRILSMLCQPIIENSVMHGLDDKLNSDETAIIKINIAEEDEFLCISVYDNGKGISPEKINTILLEESKDEVSSKDRLHIGLANTHKRIKMIFGENYGLSLSSEVGQWTEVKIRLPKIRSNDDIA